MKKLLAIFTLITIMSFTTSDYSSYCDGWDDGYKDGWCYNDMFCIPPIPPICPIPRIGESYNSYKQGYQRGFVNGNNDRNN